MHCVHCRAISDRSDCIHSRETGQLQFLRSHHLETAMRASFRYPSAKFHAMSCPRLRSLRIKCTAGAQQQKPLVVVGSINADLVLKVECLPQPGETIAASSLEFFPGGKGANQAAAAAKLGWPTILVGQLGSDSNAEALQEALAAAGVQLQHVRRVKGPSGTAVILLQSSGDCLIRSQFSATLNETIRTS